MAGSFRSTYPIIPEANRNRSTPHFSWFQPGNYLAGTRNAFNPFQGTQNNPEAGFAAVPIRCMPINEAANNVVDPVESLETQPSKPTKKQKNSKKNSTEAASKEPKLKVKKGQSSKAKGASPSAKRERKNPNFRSYDSSMDASGTPAPICTCTGVGRQCYRWGSGGWQSSCCTTNISEYPLPMSATRPGARTAGRKMSHGAYDKLLQRLAAEGYDLTLPIDLKDHWAKHGTNKFVTIK